MSDPTTCAEGPGRASDYLHMPCTMCGHRIHFPQPCDLCKFEVRLQALESQR